MLMPPSPRCRFDPATLDHKDEIRRVFAANADLFRLLETARDPEDMATSLLRLESLPPGGDPKRAWTAMIRPRETDGLHGILALYRGHPHPEALYIGGLYLLPDVHRQGLGAEIVRHLQAITPAQGFRTLYAGIGLKNWPALRFWLAMGFNRVTKMSGDDVHDDANFANIELVHDLEG